MKFYNRRDIDPRGTLEQFIDHRANHLNNEMRKIFMHVNTDECLWARARYSHRARVISLVPIKIIDKGQSLCTRRIYMYTIGSFCTHTHALAWKLRNFRVGERRSCSLSLSRFCSKNAKPCASAMYVSKWGTGFPLRSRTRVSIYIHICMYACSRCVRVAGAASSSAAVLIGDRKIVWFENRYRV